MTILTTENGYEPFWDSLVPAETMKPCGYCSREAMMHYAGSFRFRGKVFDTYKCQEGEATCAFRKFAVDMKRTFVAPTFSYERKEEVKL